MSGHAVSRGSDVAGEKLRIVAGESAGAEIPLDDELVIGRSSPGPGMLPHDGEVSRRHARISRTPEGFFLIEDLTSSNGTYLNGWRIPSPQVLNRGDRLQVGQTVLEVSLPDDTTRTSIQRRPAVLSEAVPTARRAAAERVEDVSPTALLSASGIRKSYGPVHVLKGLDLEVQPGEICGLLGPNGAGKTTFVSIVSGLRKPDAGSVYVNGVDALAHPKEACRYLGIAPQDLGIYRTMTVRRNLQLFGEISGLRGKALAERVEEVGNALSLTPKFDAKAGTLSGGQQRRLHTGMALMHKPPLLILDEPTVGADIPARQEVLDLVKKLASEGHAIIYSTHYLPEIEELGASVAILEGGTIIARGSIAELVAKHSTRALELHFDGLAPELESDGLDGDMRREGSVIRIVCDDPATAAAGVLPTLGANAFRLTHIELIRPSLDSVYLALTDRPYTGIRQLPPELLEEIAALLAESGRAPR